MRNRIKAADRIKRAGRKIDGRHVGLNEATFGNVSCGPCNLPGRSIDAGNDEAAPRQLARDGHAGTAPKIEHVGSGWQIGNQFLKLAGAHGRAAERLHVSVDDLIVAQGYDRLSVGRVVHRKPGVCVSPDRNATSEKTYDKGYYQIPMVFN